MNKRQRFLDACHCRRVDVPPIWLMRQAGRALPEYRALKEKFTFVQLVQNPELAAEVTLQPVRRFGFDAAILFSDILVIPEALGQKYHFREGGGIQMDFAIRGSQDLKRLHWDAMLDHCRYVEGALGLLKRELKGEHALIGFSGSPWTLANFMIEGGSTPEFRKALAWWEADQHGFETFLDRLTQSVMAYVSMQIDAGAEAIQIFDSMGGLLPLSQYPAASGRWIKTIVKAVSGRVPVIVFARVPAPYLGELVAMGAQVVSLESSISLADARLKVPEAMAIQGNLGTEIMTSTADAVETAARRLLEQMNGRRGYIFNLGHGLPPNTPIENIVQLVDAVRKFEWQN